MTFIQMMKRFIGYKKGVFFAYIFFSALLASSGLLLPWLVKVFIENLELYRVNGFDKKIFVEFIVCSFFIYFAYQRMVIYVGVFVESNIYNFRHELLNKIIYAPFHEAKRNDFSALAHHIIQDISGIEKNLIQLLTFFTFHFFVILGVFSIMATVNWMLFIITVIFFGLSVLSINYFGDSLEETGYRSQNALLKTFSKIQDIFKGLHTIKIYGLEKKQIKKLNALNQDYYLKTVEFIKKEAVIRPFDYLLEIVGICVVLFIGGILVQKQQITIPYLFSFILYIELLGEPASHLSIYIVACKNIKNFLNRLSGLLKNTENMQPSYFNAKNEISDIKHISIQNLSFHYPSNSRNILKDINLEVKKGDIIGICGKNGTGKTTLIEILLGFLKPSNGQILINNVDLYDLKEKDWRHKITLMPQKPHFFEDTVKNNLILLNTKAQENKLNELISIVGAERIISNLPDGLDTVLMNNLIELSGGEIQKLSLIRVLLIDPEVIILDEPFNHLDQQSCENLKEVILKISKNKMIFIIEHHHAIIDEITTKTILLGESK